MQPALEADRARRAEQAAPHRLAWPMAVVVIGLASLAGWLGLGYLAVGLFGH